MTWTVALTLTADVGADAELTADEALRWLLTGACAACGRLTCGTHLSASENK